MIIKKGADPIENLEDVKKCVNRTVFPAKKSAIFSQALREGVNMNVLTIIQTLPNRIYFSQQEVFHQIGLTLYERRDSNGKVQQESAGKNFGRDA